MGARRQRGATAVELTIALLVVLMLGLGLFQFVMVYQARLAVEQAAVEAARSGSTGHASIESIQRGLARGLAPLLYGADDAAELQANEARALARIAAAQLDGSIQLQRLAPSEAAFSDWEETALDERGEPIAGQMEIPNDNLDVRRTRSQPRSGVAGYRGGEPIGAASGVTLVDANLIRVELLYGVRLAVPVAGRLIASTLRAWHGCGAADGGGPGAGGNAAVLCPHLQADPPRLPLRVVATVRMMSPARRAAAGAGGGSGAGTGGAGGAADGGSAGSGSTGGGSVASGEGSDPGAAPVGSPDGQAGRGASGRTGGGSGSADRSAQAVADRLGSGFLFIGSDREYSHPAVCGGA